MEVYENGSLAEVDHLPSEGLLAIRAKYSDAADGLSLLLRGEDYVAAEESAIDDMADREYDGLAEPTGGAFSIAPCRVDILRMLRPVSLEYTRGALKFLAASPPPRLRDVQELRYSYP